MMHRDVNAAAEVGSGGLNPPEWTPADIDLFVYGLDADAAQKKLLAILARLQVQ